MENMRFWYPASITQITEINDSFDSCMLRVCYAGKNRNRSVIPKSVIEQAIPTMAYCPLVANYDVDADTIGGHDVRIVETDDGSLKMVNLTDAIGVIPADPQWQWETVTEADGTEHEYLSTPAILWKRTPVYDKLKRDGVSGQSMEISVHEGRLVDGLFNVDAFSFTAFCLLGEDVEPCFESANVSMFSANNIAERLNQMMDDFKQQFSVIAAQADDNIPPIGEDSFTKGGGCYMDNNELVQELMKKYGLTADDIDFDTNAVDSAEIEALFAEIAKKFDDEPGSDTTQGNEDDNTGEDEPDDSGNDDTSDGDSDEDESGSDDASDDTPSIDDNEEDDACGMPKKKNYSLTGEQLGSGIRAELSKPTYTDEWGEWSRYGYVDYDAQVSEVYAYDYTDFNLYGFTYSLNGDNVVIDFDSKKRKKFAFVDFDMGDAQFNYAAIVENMNGKFAAMTNEIDTLRKFKNDVDARERSKQVNELFANFADLNDDAAFVELCNNCAQMSIQDIEEKCFAIRGRKVQMKFSQDAPKPVRLPVEHKTEDPDEPYGGVFREYGII